MASLREDPTQTMGIEKRWLREINRRWALFEKTILVPLDNNLQLNAMDADASQIRVYMVFLQQQIDSILMVTTEAPNWQATYQLRAYERAIERSRQELRRQGANIALTIEELQQAQLLIPADFTATPSLGSGVGTAVQNPIHQDSISLLYTRSYESLEGVTSAMAKEVRQILTDGVRQGAGVKEITRDIQKRISVSKSKAELIAQTEVGGAYRIGQINQADIASEELDEPVNMRWLTRLDSKVRDIHARWHGTITTPEEADIRNSVSPFRCRCSLAPVIEEADTPKKQEKFDEQRKTLLAL